MQKNDFPSAQRNRFCALSNEVSLIMWKMEKGFSNIVQYFQSNWKYSRSIQNYFRSNNSSKHWQALIQQFFQPKSRTKRKSQYKKRSPRGLPLLLTFYYSYFPQPSRTSAFIKSTIDWWLSRAIRCMNCLYPSPLIIIRCVREPRYMMAYHIGIKHIWEQSATIFLKGKVLIRPLCISGRYWVHVIRIMGSVLVIHSFC